MTELGAGLPARLIQVVARFRPDADGVGETALRIADILWKDHRVPSDFLVYYPPRPDRVLEIPDTFPHTIERLNAAGGDRIAGILDRHLAAASSSAVLLLHYAPYGYSPQGMPFWLPRLLERFVRGGGRLLTLFHELYALRRFPSKTFITSGIQRSIYRRILATSHAAFTSNESFLDIMRRDDRAQRPIHRIGICSTAGEPENPRPIHARKRRIAVFGRFVTRKQLYAIHLPMLQKIAKHLGIDEVADIGPVDDPRWLEENVLRPVGPMVRSYGTLSVEAASRLLEDSVVGALSYPYVLRGKSGIFAAYQAHATAILLFPHGHEQDPHEPGSWLVTAAEMLALNPGLLPARLQETASAGLQDYRQHRSANSMCQTLLAAMMELGNSAPAHRR